MNKSLRKDRREDWNGVRQHLLGSDEGWQEHQGILYYVDRQSDIPKDCHQPSKPYYTIAVVEKNGRAGVPSSLQKDRGHDSSSKKQPAKSKGMLLARKRRARRKRVHKLLVALLVVTAFCFGFFGRTLFDAYAKEDTDLQNRYYTSIQVEPGDNLWKIASRYSQGSSYSIPEYVEELKRMNGLKDGHIHAGEYLTIVYFSE